MFVIYASINKRKLSKNYLQKLIPQKVKFHLSTSLCVFSCSLSLIASSLAEIKRQTVFFSSKWHLARQETQTRVMRCKNLLFSLIKIERDYFCSSCRKSLRFLWSLWAQKRKTRCHSHFYLVVLSGFCMLVLRAVCGKFLSLSFRYFTCIKQLIKFDGRWNVCAFCEWVENLHTLKILQKSSPMCFKSSKEV
jgi:hypothetical protein